MAIAIKPLRKFTTGTPTTGDMVEGELAVNTADQKIWVRDGSNNIIEVGNVSAGGGASVTISETAPGGPSAGDLWWDSTDDDARLKIYYTDATPTSQWVTASPGGGTVAGSNTQIQFNNSDNFGASANLTWTTGTNTLYATNIGASIATLDRLDINNSSPTIYLKETDASSNNQRWAIDVSSEQMTFAILSDNGASSTDWLAIDRTLQVVDEIQLDATLVDINANLDVSGTYTGTLSSAAILAGVTMTLGSDADGDTYYRASNVLTRLAKGTAAQVLTMNGGATAPEWAAAAGGDVVDDTTPQLGGDLDMNSQDIVTTSNGDIDLDPNGSGVVVFKGNATKGSGQFELNCEQNTHAITIKGPPHSAAAAYTLVLPNDDGDADQVLKTNGSGVLDWVDQSGGGGGGITTGKAIAMAMVFG